MSEDAVRAYAREVAGRLHSALADELVGVYLGGSLALGGYEPGRSDVDVAALVRRPLSLARKESLVAAVRHEALPCPARKLELVVSVPERLPDFELNLNTGAGEHHVDVTAEHSSAFWFAIDATIVRVHGVPVLGPPAADAMPPLPRPLVEAALHDAILWQSDARLPVDDLVLNACRTRRFLDEGVWSSKAAAGAWALRRLPEPEVVAAALAVRAGEPGTGLTRERAAAWATAHAFRPDA